MIFFGASLTWGANATDPQQTSYRARVAQRMEAHYPAAHFTFRDAAIGGTGSQLGAFRMDRDVLRYHPDLVFLDFSANDGIYEAAPETMASYEALLRRIIGEAQAPVVPVIFPFGWDVKAADLDNMKRRGAHLALAKLYHAPAGDAIKLAVDRVKSGDTSIEKIWPTDLVHPGDAGYELFADAAWEAFRTGVKTRAVCTVPEKPLHADTYLRTARVRFSTLGNLPQGWKTGIPNLTSAYFDMLMSRWLDDEIIASSPAPVPENGIQKPVPTPMRGVAPLVVKFRGSMVMLFGEGTPQSCKYRAVLDGKPVSFKPPGAKEELHEFDAAGIAGPSQGNTHHWQVLAEGLDADVDHTLQIIPIFTPGVAQEFRLESLCVAGGDAKIFPFHSP